MPDVLVVDEPVDLDALWAVNPALVVVTITPFGCDGPWVGRPCTEFTLQAWAGATGSRGYPDGPPTAVGGRLGEWVAGTYAAVGASRRGGPRNAGQAAARRRWPARLHRRDDGDDAVDLRIDVGLASARVDHAVDRGAVDRADVRRLRRVHDQQRAAVQRLLPDDRPPRSARGTARHRAARRALRSPRGVPRARARVHDEAHDRGGPRGRRRVPHPERPDAQRRDRQLVPAVRRARRVRAARRLHRPAGAVSDLRRSSRLPPDRHDMVAAKPRASPRDKRGKAARRSAGRGLHGVVGRAGGRARARLPRRRRDQGRVDHPARPRPLRGREAADHGPVVGVGPDVPRRQRRQARHHARPHTSGRAWRCSSACSARPTS